MIWYVPDGAEQLFGTETVERQYFQRKLLNANNVPVKSGMRFERLRTYDDQGRMVEEVFVAAVQERW